MMFVKIRYLVFVYLVVAAVTALEAGQSEGDKRICEPRAHFKEDCNDCICSKDGKSRACTLKLCPPDDTAVPRTRHQTVHSRSCTPGESFRVSCNTCTCGSDGFSVACTRMACPESVYNEDGSLTISERVPNNSLLRRGGQVNHNRACEPGKTFHAYCNTCSCGSDGFSVACTKMACPENVYNEDGSLKNTEPVPIQSSLRRRRQVKHSRACVPGDIFRVSCNTCTCGSDGFSVACTRMACPESVYNEDGSLKISEQVPNNSLLRRGGPVNHNRACVPGETFQAYCNTCSCGSDGFSVACTKMACPENIYNEDGSLKNTEQVPTDTLLRRRRQAMHTKPCVPGETFKIDCNSCKCTSAGLPACTLMSCGYN